MAITFVGSDSGQTGANTTGITLSLPTHTTDDVGVIYGRCDESGTVAVLSIGTATGWTLLTNVNPTQGRDRVEYIWYKRFTSGFETNPVMNTSISQEKSASVHVFRGVDTVTMFDTTFTSNHNQNDSTPINAAITTLTDNACLLLYHGSTHDDVTTAGAPATPSGMTIGETVLGAANDHRGQVCAYKLNVGVAATYTPTAWTHTVSAAAVAEYSTFTIALRENQPIHITDVNTDEQIDLSETNMLIAGDGFEAVQGTGLVELGPNADYTGTKVTQTIDSWSDTSVQFDFVQGSILEGTNFLFVTNDSGDRSLSQVNVGEVGYDLSMLLPGDHYWTFNNKYDDEIGGRPMNNVLLGTPDFEAISLVRGSTHALRMNGSTDRAEMADSTLMNTATHTRRDMGGFIRFDSVQLTPTAIYEEGGGVNNFYFILGFGGILLANCADSSNGFKVQAYSDFKLAPNRTYHILFSFQGNAYNNEFVMYVDGVKQLVTDGNPIGNTVMASHSGDCGMGRPDGTLDTGGTDIQYDSAVTLWLAHWISYSGALSELTSTEIRETLFELAAIQTNTLGSGTQSSMQTALEVFDDTTQIDSPMDFKVYPPTGGGDLELTASNIIHNARSSINIQWVGDGTLTWRNSGTSNASIVSTTNGGTVVFVETAQCEITVRADSDSALLVGSRVFVIADSGGPLPAEAGITLTRVGAVATAVHTSHGLKTGDQIFVTGSNQSDYNGLHIVTVTTINAYTFTVAGSPTTPATGTIVASSVIIQGLSNASGFISAEIDYSTNQPVTGYVRDAAGGTKYKESPLQGTITASGFQTTIRLRGD